MAHEKMVQVSEQTFEVIKEVLPELIYNWDGDPDQITFQTLIDYSVIEIENGDESLSLPWNVAIEELTEEKFNLGKVWGFKSLSGKMYLPDFRD